MTREYLVKHYIMSTYISENDVVDYFINLSSCKEKDIAYLYSYEEKDIIKMRIFKIIWRSENPYFYDNFKEDDITLFRRIFIENVSHAEVAAELGITVWTSQKRLERIRKRIREEFPDF